MNLNTNLAQLLKRNTKPGQKISICIPTHPKSNSQTIQEDETRFKNALQSIENNYPNILNSDLASQIKVLEKLLDNVDFWHHQDLSLLIFADKDGVYGVKISTECTPYAYVGEEFMLAPLAIILSMSTELQIFDFSLNHARLLEGSSPHLELVSDFSTLSMDDLLDDDNQPNHQFQNTAGNRSSTPMYYGHGGKNDQREEDVSFYLQYLARSLDKYLQNKTTPLILSGDEHRIAEFKKYLNYKYISDRMLAGNSEHLSVEDISNKLRQEDDELLSKHLADITSQFTADEAHGKSAIGFEKINEKIDLSAVKNVVIQCIRMTKDSVRGGKKEELLLDFTGLVNEQFAKIVSRTLAQGGGAIAVRRSVFNDDKLRAQLRF